MLFTNKIVFNLPNVYVGNDLLQWTDSIKYLSFIIENKVNFNLQLHNISNKLQNLGELFFDFRIFLTKVFPFKNLNILICYCTVATMVRL